MTDKPIFNQITIRNTHNSPIKKFALSRSAVGGGRSSKSSCRRGTSSGVRQVADSLLAAVFTVGAHTCRSKIHELDQIAVPETKQCTNAEGRQHIHQQRRSGRKKFAKHEADAVDAVHVQQPQVQTTPCVSLADHGSHFFYI